MIFLTIQVIVASTALALYAGIFNVVWVLPLLTQRQRALWEVIILAELLEVVRRAQLIGRTRRSLDLTGVTDFLQTAFLSTGALGFLLPGVLVLRRLESAGARMFWN